MSISEDQLAALEADVAELLGILEELDSDEGDGGTRRYAGQVARISSTAGALGFRGLRDICLLFQQGLTNSGLVDRGLNDAGRELLEEWPTLVMGYLMSPSDPQSGEALLDHLQNPVWKTYLPANEAKVLQGLLMRDLPVIEPELPAFEPSEPAAIVSDLAKPTREEETGFIRVESGEAAEPGPEAQIEQAVSAERADAAFQAVVPSGAPPAAMEPSPAPPIQEDQPSPEAPFQPEETVPAQALPEPLEDVPEEVAEVAAIANEPPSAPEYQSPDLDAVWADSDAKIAEQPTWVSAPEPEAVAMPATGEQGPFSEPAEPATLGPDSTDRAIATPILEHAVAEFAEATDIAAMVESAEEPVAAEVETETAFARKTETADQIDAIEGPAALADAPAAEPPEEEIEEEPAVAAEEEPVEDLDEELEEEPEVAFEEAGADDGDEEAEPAKAEEAEAVEDFEEGLALAEDALEETAATAPSAAQQEMLEIISAEITQIPETAADLLNAASSAEGTPESWNEALSGYAEQLELLGNASASMGLSGLQEIFNRLQGNLAQLANQGSPLSAQQRRLLEAWPAPALAYLSNLNDRAASGTLVQLLTDHQWPEPLKAEEAASLIERLAAPELVSIEAEIEARPQQAQPEDVSLRFPADGNQQLLDSLLQELPHQAAEFSAAIQRLAVGEGDLKDVEVAQRIAHTLKGAGNTVGVRGIATLTHHVEDILQALSKEGALPTRPLAHTLLNASDCLEIMSEALLGMSAPPSQALEVLQEVLDWANQIDRSGIPKGEERLPEPAPDRTRPSVEEEPSAAQPAPASAEALLRVPAHMVDDLLRLMGESFILTGQVQERVRRTLAQTKSMLTQNRSLQQLTTELEQLIDIRNVSSPLSKSMQRGDFDPLELEQYNELYTVTHRLLETATDARELNRIIEENLASLDSLLVDQSRLHRDSQQAVLRTRMVPVQTVAPRFQRSVRQTCRLVNKEAELVMSGTDTLVDSNVLNGMVDPLMHILRNAVDHGIEPAEQRRRSGKPPAGNINLSFVREGNHIVIRCQDDGAGLNLPAIRRTAAERGLLASDKALSEDELIRLILLPGFSTQSQTTQTSGRGIGMDVVYSRLLDMKGSLRIQTKAGEGCLMELRLPVTLISTHALLLRIRNQIYALSDRGIEQILYYGVGSIQTVGNTTTFRLENDIYELTNFGALLNLPPDRREKHRTTPPIILVRDERGAIQAVLAEEIVDSRDLVVKNLGGYLPKLDGIVGATILGDGSVAPVLDLPELLRSRRREHRPSLAPQAPSYPNTPQRQVVLAVDDSLSARRSLAQFIQDAGFEVRTARDGLEAIEVINRKIPDLILVDLEMPRMNGLELTAHLRGNSSTQKLPIIMITSRSTDKHRREAQTMGVDAYLTKPFVEDELLDYIHRLLAKL